MHCLYILYMFATLALRRCIVISHACALGLLNQHVKELIVIAKLTPLKILTHVQSLQPPEGNLHKNTLYIVYIVKVGPPVFYTARQPSKILCFSVGQIPQNCSIPFVHLHLSVMHVPWTHSTWHPKLHLDRFGHFCTAHGKPCKND